MKPIYLVLSTVLIAALMMGTACFAAEDVFNVELRAVDQSISRTGAIRVQMVVNNFGENTIPVVGGIPYHLFGRWSLNNVNGSIIRTSGVWSDTPLTSQITPHSTGVIYMINLRNLLVAMPRTLPPGAYLLTFDGQWEGDYGPQLRLSLVILIQ